MSVTRLLIANRGEIAIRIARAAADMGLPTVAVHSPDDARSVTVWDVPAGRELFSMAAQATAGAFFSPGGWPTQLCSGHMVGSLRCATNSSSVSSGNVSSYLSSSTNLSGDQRWFGLTSTLGGIKKCFTTGWDSLSNAMKNSPGTPLMSQGDGPIGESNAVMISCSTPIALSACSRAFVPSRSGE